MSETTCTEESTNTSLAASTEQQLVPVSQAIERTFTELGRNLTEELARVSLDGRSSIRDLADGVIEDLARIAAQRVLQGPLNSLLGEGGGDPSQRVIRSVINRSFRNG